jgi:NADP-dependent 3-hydroxy acid dehydrogenase YdfG
MTEPKQRALIVGTGAIGSACARRFGADGARIALADVDVSKLEALAEPLAAMSSVIDLRDAESTEALRMLIDGLGGLDLLVFAAGPTWFGDVLNEDAHVFHELLKTSVLGLKRALVAATGALEQSRGLAVIVSGADGRVPDRFTELWGVTSACAQAMLKCYAAEVGPRGVRTLNLVVHGVAGGGFDEVAGELASTLGVEEDDAHRLFGVRRIGAPASADEVAAAIAGLARAPLYGATLALDGGATGKYWP